MLGWLGDNLWGLMVVVLPLALGAVLLWALLRNRKVTPRQHAETERATRDLYKDIAAEDRAKSGE